MLGWICEKMATQELAQGGGGFSASSSIVARNGTSACSSLCITSGGYSTAIGNGS